MALLLSAVLATVACGDDSKRSSQPTAPTTPTAPSVTPQSIAIGGHTSFNHPGETSQITVTAVHADGTTRDVTAQARCRTHPSDSYQPQNQPYSVVQFGSGCLLKALAYGRQDIVVMYPSYGWWPPPRNKGRPSDGSCRARRRLRAPRGRHGSGIPARRGQSGGDDRFAHAERCGQVRILHVCTDRGEVVVRAEMHGHSAQVKRLTAGRDEQVDLDLPLPDPFADITGVYRLTFTASPSCALPAEAMQRTYVARIMEGQVLKRPEDLITTVAGVVFVGWANDDGFTGTRDGQTVRFDIGDDITAAYALIELIDSAKELYYRGTATGSPSRPLLGVRECADVYE